MSKALAWVFGATKIGKVVEKARVFLWGKKTYLAGLSTAVPALFLIVNEFAEKGTPYLLALPSTEEFSALMLGIGMITGRAAITKAGADK